jgi:hypothetical protein
LDEGHDAVPGNESLDERIEEEVKGHAASLASELDMAHYANGNQGCQAARVKIRKNY